jgi:hypothetical protein
VWWNFEDILSIFALGLFSFFKLVFEALEIWGITDFPLAYLTLSHSWDVKVSLFETVNKSTCLFWGSSSHLPPPPQSQLVQTVDLINCPSPSSHSSTLIKINQADGGVPCMKT